MYDMYYMHHPPLPNYRYQKKRKETREPPR
jgi:hypothetical protein